MAGESEGPYRTGGRRREPEGPERSASSQATPARILTKLLVFAVPNLVYAGVCVAGLASWSGAAAVFFVTSLLVAPVRADVRDAKATLVTLPFPVHHDPPSVLEFPELSCVREVRIQLVDRLDGISADHQAFLKAGGYGFIIGDGNLNYGHEAITEFYYSAKLMDNFWLSFDYQFVVNPGYNKDRHGPVNVFGFRGHVAF